MKRRSRELVQGGGAAADAYAGVRTERIAEERQAVVARRQIDPHHQVVRAVGQHRRRRPRHAARRQIGRRYRHHVLRHREDAASQGAAVRRMGNQVGELRPLTQHTCSFRFPVLLQADLMPGMSIADGNEDGPARERPVGELGVLAAPARKRLVEAASEFVQVASDAQIPCLHGHEQIVVP